MTLAPRVSLLIIDPQNDFVLDGAPLQVPGAQQDMARLTDFVRKHGGFLSEIHVSLDSHQLLHIANPEFWHDGNGNHPEPFTIISVNDLRDKKWLPSFSSFTQQDALNYAESLEKDGKYKLCIWPPHCLLGSPGHNVVSELFGALCEWESLLKRRVNYILKGNNRYTEHYSAVKADVLDPEDPATGVNTQLVDSLRIMDQIVVAGEAGSHCVANTVRDLVSIFGDAKKFVLLTDAISPVGGFEKAQEDFLNEMKDAGATLSATEVFLR
jgi:nicotinamidase/pyrazinamidase